MAVKQLEVEGIGTVRFQKRRGTKSVRLHIQGHTVQVTMPYWVSFAEATRFVQSRHEWINEHKLDRQIIADGAYIGKRFQLSVAYEDIPKPKTRIINDAIRIVLPLQSDVESVSSQSVIEKACERALKAEATELLTPRLSDLALEHEFVYNSLHFKKLQRRWGSCDTNKHIILNIFLTQLPWEYIDYVLLHELTHTEHLNHSSEFWTRLESCLPNAKKIRKQMHDYHPQILPN